MCCLPTCSLQLTSKFSRVATVLIFLQFLNFVSVFRGKKSIFSSIHFPQFYQCTFPICFFCFSRVDGSRINSENLILAAGFFFATMTSKSSMPPLAYKPKKKEPEIQGKVQKSQQKPPPKFVQKTLPRRTPTWRLEKHKQYFQNAAAWLLSIFHCETFPVDIFLSIFSSSLSQGNT